MKFVVHFSPDTLHIEMEGNFTFSDAHLFHKVMSIIKDKSSRDEIHIHIHGLDSMDSTALRFFMMAHDLAKIVHRNLVFVGAKGRVHEMLNEAAQYNALRMAA